LDGGALPDPHHPPRCVRMRSMAKAKKTKDAVGKETESLFELPPEEFTAARDELAKRMAGEGRAAEARAIKAIRRPTVAAWAVNQLARGQPRAVEELLEAGATLRRAQRKVLSGVRTSDFREASEKRRGLVTRLVRLAEDILRESGRASAGVGEAVRSTLEAASLDDDAGEMVRAGRLSKELPPPASFGAVEGLGLVPTTPEEPAAPAKPRAKRGPEKEKDEARALKAQQDAAAKEAKASGEKAAQARRAAIRSRGEADRAESRAERLREEAERARVAARDLGKKAQQAETEATRAQEAADRAARRADQLERT
jgi:hypothetical protein